jgi:hypothetical protein
MPYRIGAPATGVAAGIALGLLVSDGHLLEIAVAGALGLGLLSLTLLFPAQHRLALAALVAIGLSVHLAAVVGIDVGLRAVGLDGFVTGDDRGYARASWAIAEGLRGGATTLDWQTQGYLLGPFVYVEAGIFFLLRSPNALVVEMVNGAFAVVVMLLTFDATRRLFGFRAAVIAALLVVCFPSIVVWTSLNLKDALGLLLLSFAIWAIVRFQLVPGWRALAVVTLGVLGVWSFRSDIVILPLLGLAFAFLLTRRLSGRMYLQPVVVGVILGCVISLLLDLGGSRHTLAEALRRLEARREVSAEGARTAMVDPIVRLRARDGDTFLVLPQPSPIASFNVVHVTPGAQITVASPDIKAPSSAPVALQVRPGDVVVVGTPDRTAAPLASATPLAISPSRPVMVVPATESDADVIGRTVQYFPAGLAYAFLAPFPWMLSRAVDVATVPDVLVWYLVISAGSFAVWFNRRRLDRVVPIAAIVIVGLVGLALGEGNVGTLYRHRAMVIPPAAVLAGGGLVAASRSLRGLLRVSANSSRRPDSLRRLLGVWQDLVRQWGPH